jgi:tripartite-type tricarboxylate transporter receptor subunit TctC
MPVSVSPFVTRRRAFTGTVCAMLSMALLPSLGYAQVTFPSKPITLILPLAAGGAADALGRIWAEYATKQLGVPVVVDNRSGANGAVADTYAARHGAQPVFLQVPGL